MKKITIALCTVFILQLQATNVSIASLLNNKSIQLNRLISAKQEDDKLEITVDLSGNTLPERLTNLEGFDEVLLFLDKICVQLTRRKNCVLPRWKNVTIKAYLNDNKLTSLNEPSFIKFTQEYPIILINLDNNSITKLPKDLFKGPRETVPLQIFSVNKNKIKAFPEDFLAQASELKEFLAQDNKIRNLPKTFEFKHKLQIIDISSTKKPIDYDPETELILD